MMVVLVVTFKIVTIDDVVGLANGFASTASPASRSPRFVIKCPVFCTTHSHTSQVVTIGARLLDVPSVASCGAQASGICCRSM